MKSTAEIVALYHERKKRRAPEFATAQLVRDHYNGDIVVPLPEMERNEAAGVANLLSMGLDQMSMRSASTQPDPFFPPLRPGFDKHEKAASDRHKAVLGWWQMNNMPLIDARRFRHFYGYNNSPVLIVPDFKRKVPKWEIRDPLMTYPSSSSDPDCMTPDDCIFAYHKPLRWLRDNYEDAYNRIARRRGETEDIDEMFEIVEYIDAEEMVLVVVGSQRVEWDLVVQGSEVEELVRYPNRAGICTAVIPGRVTLDRPQGQFDGMLGMFQQQAMLQALSVIATKKGIFKDEWIVARQGEIPKVVRQANGLKGQTGILQGGDIKEMPLDAAYMAPQMIDRLERYQRLEGGIPAAFGGETTTNVRTGRMGDNILGATIDFTVQEAQKVMALARKEEDVRAIAIDKAYWRKPKAFYVPWNGKQERLDYNPEKLWESDEHTVVYSQAGVDENGRTIAIGQMLGMELISKQEARQMHPMVRDPLGSEAAVVREALERAVLGSLQQMASQPGGIPLPDLARIGQLVTQEGKDIIAAVIAVQEEAQKRQASQDAEGNPTAVDPNSPEAQPGIAMPDQGAEAAAAIQGPNDSQANFANLLARLRQPQMTMPSERGGAANAS